MGNIFAGKLHIALLCVLAVITMAGYLVLPLGASVPIHWNASGEPDAFAASGAALAIAPGVALSLLALPLILGLVQSNEQREAGRHIERTALTAAAALAVVMQVITIAAGFGIEVDVPRVLAFAFAALLVVLGNALPKSRRNQFAGIRWPSTLSDDANWQATQRFGGILYIASGFILALVAILTSQPQILISAILAAAVLPALAAIVFSMRYKVPS